MCSLRLTRSLALAFAALAIPLVAGPTTAAMAQAYRYDPGRDYYHNDTAAGTLFGGALGAVTGAIAGGKDNRGEGALIGAGIGAVTGNLFGRTKDQADARQAAAGSAAVQRLNAQVAAQAVTNHDLVRMSQAGVSDDLIVSTLRSRGARLDLSPQALIALKQQGVSDQVMLAAQQLRSGTRRVTPTPTVIVREPAPVIVEPLPWYPYHYGPHYCPHTHPYGGLHFRFGF